MNIIPHGCWLTGTEYLSNGFNSKSIQNNWERIFKVKLTIHLLLTEALKTNTCYLRMDQPLMTHPFILQKVWTPHPNSQGIQTFQLWISITTNCPKQRIATLQRTLGTGIRPNWTKLYLNWGHFVSEIRYICCNFGFMFKVWCLWISLHFKPL